ncbi:MAG TPA: response regulator transcription factor [Anaeromyxobacteraceae bacterium]|nr:response regulator transcription factor [Anaeromyxobacteraceae bacterium]
MDSVPAEAALQQPEEDRGVALARQRILVVDDDPELRAALVEALEAEGFTVDEAEDGIQALERIADAGPDVLLVDYGLPRLAGDELVRRLRALGVNAPVVLVTAADRAREVAEAMGVERWVGKPVSLRELLAQVRRAASEA